MANESSKFNINLFTGNVTTIDTKCKGAPTSVVNDSQQILPPPSPDVPSSSKTFTAKATPPGKVKAKEVLEKSSNEYIRRRQRNNVAVKKSREKMREKTVYTLEKVEQLKIENEQLESKISILTKELVVLKDLFMDHAKGFCTGGSVGIMSPDQLESLLGCKVIKSGPNPDSTIHSTPVNNSAVPSPIEPLINAAEIEFMSLKKIENRNNVGAEKSEKNELSS